MKEKETPLIYDKTKTWIFR